MKKIAEDIFKMHKINFTRDNLVIISGDIDAEAASIDTSLAIFHIGETREIPKLGILKKGQIS